MEIKEADYEGASKLGKWVEMKQIRNQLIGS